MLAIQRARRELLQRELEHAQVILCVARARIAGAQDAGEYLAAPADRQRMKAALVVAGVPLLAARRDRRCSKSRITRSGATPAFHARARASARAWQIASISASPTDSSTRRTVEMDATSLNSAG
jgi:hypothetical protein